MKKSEYIQIIETLTLINSEQTQAMLDFEKRLTDHSKTIDKIITGMEEITKLVNVVIEACTFSKN